MRTVPSRPRLHAAIAVAGASLLLVLSLGLMGCQRPSADVDRIAELEEQIERLQDQLDRQESSGSSDATQEAPQSDTSDDSATSFATSDIAAFEERVASLEDECSAVKASNDISENYQTYLEMESKLDALEREIDAYDDQQEMAARSGELSREEYIQIENQLDALDDRLDRSGEMLEHTLGVDD